MTCTAKKPGTKTTLCALLFGLAVAACVADGTNGGGDDDDDGGPVAKCGDATCQASESPTTCPADCKADPICGNKSCETGETPQTCPADCMAQPVCGNHTCEAGETAATCPADCNTCGNHVCEAGETTSCPTDCPASLRVQNNSTYYIYEMYVAPCGSSGWGPDLLPGYLAPNSGGVVNNIPPGCYNFRAASGSIYWQRFNTVLEASAQFTWTLLN